MTAQQKFEANLQLAKEENPTKSLAEQIELAKEWTIVELTHLVVRIAGYRLAGHEEAVNKAFYS